MLRRLFSVLLLLALVPGTWLRDPPRRLDLRQQVTIKALPLPAGCCRIGPIAVSGVWQLTSPNQQFGGYSALVQRASGRLLAISDGAFMLDFPLPGERGPVRIGPAMTGPAAERAWRKQDRDTEAAVWDPVRARLWLAAEGRNSILRLGPDFAVLARVRPPAMAHWPRNTGPESMTRLPDGRFLVLCECQSRAGEDGAHPALLFPGDPTLGGAPLRFTVASDWDYRPTDAAALPDGRVLVVLRRLVWPFPTRFAARLALLDPAQARPGAVLPLVELGEIAAPLPVDNYEGLVLVPGPGGQITGWLISDDNGALAQRTLLLRLQLRLENLPRAQQKARR